MLGSRDQACSRGIHSSPRWPIASILSRSCVSSRSGSVEWGSRLARARYQSSSCAAEVAAKSSVRPLNTIEKHCQSSSLCYSIVFKERTLDFAATSVEGVLDWYLALATLVPQSTEPLLDEPALRERLATMGLAPSTAQGGGGGGV